MSQLRFKIGVPQAGDAARAAEALSSESDGWTRAKKVALSGSAARAAEERKREEESGPKRGNTIALRAGGGAVVDRETMMRHSGMPGRTAAPEDSSIKNIAGATDFPAGERISVSRTVSAQPVASAAGAREPEPDVPPVPVQQGLLQSAASRLQSLTRSLFQRRNADGQPQADPATPRE